MRLFNIQASAVGLLLLGVIPAVQAAVTIEPAALKLIMSGEGVRTEHVMIANDGEADLVLRVEPEYWFQGSCTQPVNSWLKALPEQLVVPAHQNFVLELKLSLPAQLSGECVAMVYLAQKPQGQLLAIQTRVGFPVYVQRQSSGETHGEISKFEPRRIAGVGAAFEIEVRNTGNLHILPFGSLLLQDDAGRLYHQPVRFEQPVFPGQSRGERIICAAGFVPPGRYHAKLDLFLDNVYPRQEGCLPALSRETVLTVERP